LVEEVTHRLGETLDVLGNGVRLKILFLLEDSKKNVSSIADEMDRSQQSISSHLQTLRHKNLLESETEGRKRFYWVKRPDILELVKEIRDCLSRPENS
jgi:ArsR family transcriptional regulator